MWDIVVSILVVGGLIIESYSLGLKNGQKLNKEEKINTIIDPVIRRINNYNFSKLSDVNKEDQIEWDNINNYNGTKDNQKEIE